MTDTDSMEYIHLIETYNICMVLCHNDHEAEEGELPYCILCIFTLSVYFVYSLYLSPSYIHSISSTLNTHSSSQPIYVHIRNHITVKCLTHYLSVHCLLC